MNDDNLRRQLRQLPVPPASEIARARARHRALIAFQQTGPENAPEPRRRGPVLIWRGALALALIAGCLSFLVFKHRTAPENLANDYEVLHQVEKLFPHQVDAVIEENGKVDLSIAQSPTVGFDQPVLVIFQRGPESIRVLSYSGHRVCLALGQARDCFEILETPSGGVILETENGAWLASQHPVVSGYSIRAQRLEASL